MKRQGRKPSQTDQAGLLQKLYYLMYLQVTSHKSTKLIPGIMSIRLVIYIRPNTIKIMLCIFSYLHVNKAEQTHSTDYLPCNKTLTKPLLNDVTLSLLEIRSSMLTTLNVVEKKSVCTRASLSALLKTSSVFTTIILYKKRLNPNKFHQFQNVFSRIVC